MTHSGRDRNNREISPEDHKKENESQRISKEELQKLMKAAHIPGISLAVISDGKPLWSTALGVSDKKSKTPASPDTPFWACSLSKPVFSYLVLKLIEANQSGKATPELGQFNLPKGIDKFDLDTPLHLILKYDDRFSTTASKEHREAITARMVLSHATGLPNWRRLLLFDFAPGTSFGYSGEGFLYLQKIIEKLTGSSLEQLAKQIIFDPLKMEHSHFSTSEMISTPAINYDELEIALPSPPPDSNAAGSLYTTANDYACFLSACLNDDNFTQHALMKSTISLMEDKKAFTKSVKKETLEFVDWGLGFGLQITKRGTPEAEIMAFHWGHGPGTRAFFAMNLQTRSAVVYFSNSDNGLAIIEDILIRTVGDLQHGLDWLFKKEGYAKWNTPEWKAYHGFLRSGIAAEEKGNYSDAEKFYKEAMKIRPKNNELEYRIAWAAAHTSILATPDIEKLNELKGQYGSVNDPVRIFVHDSKLQIEEGGRIRDLKVIDKNTFLDDKVILKFNTDSIPPILTCHFTNGMKAELIRAPTIALSSMAHTATILNIPLTGLTSSDSETENKKEKCLSPDSNKKSSSLVADALDDEISDEEMERSALGQGSDTAKKFKS